MNSSPLRLFVSSPGDVPDERRRVELVVEKLNAEFEGRARIEAIRWETSYYSADETFQKQIPEAADCDLVVAVFRGRLGTPLPPSFPRLPDGEPYPSGTAYEVLSAILARKAGKPLPDIFVFRYPHTPTVMLDAPDRAEIEAQWTRLKAFFDAWFRTPDGQFVRAFQGYESTDDFAAKIEDCLRQWLAKRGFAAQTQWDRLARGSPFPGLEAFHADRGSVFFGRDLAISEAIERWREAGANEKRLPFLLILGASGGGKSSLLRAGLLPRLTQPGTIPEIDLWRPAIVVAGPDPFAALAESLLDPAALGAELRQGAFGEKTLLARLLADDPVVALAPLREALAIAAEARRREASFDAPRPARLALAVDQAERLFTEAGARVAGFAELLAALAREKIAYVVMVLRSDAYPRLQNVPALLELRRRGASFDVVSPGPDELQQMVERPAAACEPPLAFEVRDDGSLAERLVAEAKGGDALPLLQVTLARLYAAERERKDGVLRFADYHGLAEAVSETADEALQTLDAAAKAELPALVYALVGDVAADPLTSALSPFVVALERKAFEAGKPARTALIDVFVEKRLLICEGDGADARVRPVHEALLRIWPAAVKIIHEAAALIRIRHILEPIARDWSAAAASQKAGYLVLSPTLLAGAIHAVERFGDDLPEDMRAFIAEAARADAERRDSEQALQIHAAAAATNRRIARREAAALVAALLLAGFAGWKWGVEQQGRLAADARTAETARLTARAEAGEREAKAERAKAEQALALATKTANQIVSDLAQKFGEAVGVPASLIKDSLDEVRTLQDQLVAVGGDSPELQQGQANALKETSRTLLTLGQADAAFSSAGKAQNILASLLASQPQSAAVQKDLADVRMTIGDIEMAQGKSALARAAYESSRETMARLATSDPGDREAQADLSQLAVRIGNVEMGSGDLLSAIASYRESLAILDPLVKAHPDEARFRHDLSVAYNKVGDVQAALGSSTEALGDYKAGLATAESLAESGSESWRGQRDLCESYERVGDVQASQGDLVDALDAYQESLAIRERLVKSDPGNARWRHDLAGTYAKLADLHLKAKRPAEARAALDAGRAILAKLVDEHPDLARWRTELAQFDQRIAAAAN